MPVSYDQLPEFEPNLRRDKRRLDRQTDYCQAEIASALSARMPQEESWSEALRQYKAQPEQMWSYRPVRMRNIEVPLGAWAAEQAYAQHDLLAVNTSPPVSVRSGPSGDWVDHARAVQEFVNWMGANELRAADVSRTVFLDNAIYGTGIYQTNWEVHVKRTVGTTQTWQGPVARRVRPQDFLVPEGCWLGLEPTHGPPWCAARYFLTEGQIRTKVAREEWDKPAPSINREEADQVGGLGAYKEDLYEVWRMWTQSHVFFDDEDIPVDLLVTWDASGERIIDIRWSPYDCRPFDVMRYQRQTDSFWGMGVMKMLQPLQAEATDFHQDRARNRKLSMQRVFVAPEDEIVGDMTLGVGEIILTRGVGSSIQPLNQIPMWPSEMQEEDRLLAMAQQRTGLSNMPGPEAGQRTPATTESIKSNQRNSRAAPSTNDMSAAFAGMHIQGLRRYSERLRLENLRASNTRATRGEDAPVAFDVHDHIMRVMGQTQGEQVIEMLEEQDFFREVAIETTATSATLNRESELQKMFQVAPLIQQQITESVMGIRAMRQMPDPTSDAAIMHGIIAGAEVMKRILGHLDIPDGDRLVFDPRAVAAPEGAGAGTLQDALEQPQAPLTPPGVDAPPAPPPGVPSGERTGL